MKPGHKLLMASVFLPLLPLFLLFSGWLHPVVGLVLLVTCNVCVLIAVARGALAGHPGQRTRTPIDPVRVLYTDGLITITDDSITFHGYLFGSRTVTFMEIDAIRAMRPTLTNGKWRASGSTDLQTWFPTDFLRFRRDTIFIAEMKQQGQYRIGFTVKDSRRVRELFDSLHCLHPICPHCQYDLRASQDRCPECGTPITQTR